MTAALTPELALAYLGQLSTDLRAAAVLDASGRMLAGDGALGVRAPALLSAGDGADIHVALATGAVFARRGQEHAIAVVTGPLVLAGLMHHDLGGALEALDGVPTVPAAEATSPTTASGELVALAEAILRDVRPSGRRRPRSWRVWRGPQVERQEMPIGTGDSP